ncbi:MAG: RNA ligase (ATP) [Planctomycetes bacterium]|nr:RNA ligase (ATP) [Planctomycetota bacterium]
MDAAGNIAVPAGFRIRTVKLRGQYSQGICFPVSIVRGGDSILIGTEVTTELGIVKWEPPIPAGMVGKIKGPFPDFVPKTDEIRIQLLADVLERHRGKEFVVTEKLDGSSFTAFHYELGFGICSRNQWIDETDTSSKCVTIARSFQLREKLAETTARLGFDFAIQGEMIGPGIEGNKYKLDFVTLRVFNVVNLATRKLLDFEQTYEVIRSLGLSPVPFLEKLTLNHTVDELIEVAEGKSVLNESTLREGIVLRPTVESYEEETSRRLSFKAINPAFLINYEE